MKLSGSDIVDILRTLDELGYRHFRLEHGDLKLEVDAGPGRRAADAAPPETAPSETAPVAAAAPPPSTEPPRHGLVAVQAPMTGTFYRAPAPDAPPFVEVGDAVEADQTVCMVEVMKLFNSLAAGVAGTVADICADNEAAVTTGQPLIWIEPRD